MAPVRCRLSGNEKNTKFKMSKRTHPGCAPTRRSGAIRALLLLCAKSGRVSVHDHWGLSDRAPWFPWMMHVASRPGACLWATVQSMEPG